MKPDIPKLNPCPKCGTDGHVKLEIGHSPFTPATLVRATCEKCGLAGEAKTTLVEAIDAWNHTGE